MKVAITTYSGSQNYGAMLQAYALSDFIKNMGHDCFFINNRPIDERWFVPRKNIGDIITSIVKYPESKKRVQRYREFREMYLAFTKKISSASELETLNDEFDRFITGSDQVWNCSLGINECFYLSFVTDESKSIAYAASFGKSNVPDEYKERVRHLISRVKFVSIREKSSQALVEELTGKKPCLVVDPVFLKSKQEWNRMANTITLSSKPYIFVYSTQFSEEMNNAVKNYIAEHNVEVISTHAIPGVKCSVRKDIGPLEFLGLIANAEFIISTSFHATAFSVIFEKSFCVVPHSQTGTRIVDLLDDCKLSECIWKGKDYLFTKPVYSDKGTKALHDKIIYSKEFLGNALMECKC